MTSKKNGEKNVRKELAGKAMAYGRSRSRKFTQYPRTVLTQVRGRGKAYEEQRGQIN